MVSAHVSHRKTEIYSDEIIIYKRNVLKHTEKEK